MSEKNKRKGTPKRPLWQVLAILLVIAVFGFAGWHVYTRLSTSDDGADVIFLRDDGNGEMNIYTLDIDDPQAEEIAITNYTARDAEHIQSMAHLQDDSWVTYIVANSTENSARIIKRSNLKNHETSTLFECNKEHVSYCNGLIVSPDGRYLAFNATPPDMASADNLWLIDLANDSLTTMIAQGENLYTIRFISTDQIALWKAENEVVIYDITTGKINPTGIEDYDPHFSPDGSRYARLDVENNMGIIQEDRFINLSYTIINLHDGTEFNLSSPYGDMEEPYTIWHPKNNQFLTRGSVGEPFYSSEAMYGQIALIDAISGETRLLLSMTNYEIIGMEWNSDGTQFLFWRRSAEEWGYEGEIWIYDMESGEARPLNQVGTSVGWLN